MTNKIGILQDDGTVKTLSFREIRQFIRQGGYMKLAIMSWMEIRKKYNDFNPIFTNPKT